ncbi:MAG: dihydrolipoamide acetyltransferase family protein [Chitinophagales bacterium]
MAQVELIMPKMGESIMEATILKWLKEVGDEIEAEESVLEIATDKVDSEVPSPVDGVLSKILFEEGDTVEVGKAIALIETAASAESSNDSPSNSKQETHTHSADLSQTPVLETVEAEIQETTVKTRFYSPLVMNMARQEGIGMAELERITGTGKDERVTKRDMLKYIEAKKQAKTTAPIPQQGIAPKPPVVPPIEKSRAQATTSKTPPRRITPPKVDTSGNVEIVEMDRMRRLIADHMVMSKQVSPHVTSFAEIDMTDIVNWRNKNKEPFLKREGEKLTFTPIFIEAVTKAIKDYPLVNASVDGYNMIIRKDLNIGMATATPSGNLIVPVIHNADHKSLVGLAKSVNDLANRARNNKLKPNEVQGGTFTLTNVGSFGSIMGTPIINQPQVAILAVGAIRKKPAVIETEYGDVIAIRHLMIASLSYDHRIVDGALGSTFLNRVKYYLENFDRNRTL